MQFLAIVAISIAAAVGYGIGLDLIIAQIVPEYFTIGHPPVFRTLSVDLMAIGWGLRSSWWIGAVLGVALGFAANEGPRPRLKAEFVIKPMLLLVLGVALTAFVGGVLGYVAGKAEILILPQRQSLFVAQERQPLYLAAMFMHVTSYLGAVLGGTVLIWWTWQLRQRIERWQRKREEPEESESH